MFKVGDIVTCSKFKDKHCTLIGIRDNNRCTVACEDSSYGWKILKGEYIMCVGQRGWHLALDDLTLIKKYCPIWLQQKKDKE